jgi:hypothetical protein
LKNEIGILENAEEQKIARYADCEPSHLTIARSNKKADQIVKENGSKQQNQMMNRPPCIEYDRGQDERADFIFCRNQTVISNCYNEQEYQEAMRSEQHRVGVPPDSERAALRYIC